MALQRVGEKAIATFKENDKEFVKLKPKKKVLSEDEYTEGVEKIIVRDFYPDLPKLEAQKEYFDALENNDHEKLREIHIKYSIRRGPTPYATPATKDTPSTFETPIDHPKATPSDPKSSANRTTTDTTDKETSQNPEKHKDEEKLSLDQYLHKNTSEDNASFAEIMEENEKKHKLKHEWLYESEKIQQEKAEEVLALPNIEEQAAICGNPTKLQSWKYTNRNSLMYVPDGVAHSAKEKIDQNKEKPRIIVHSNTRYVHKPFDQQVSKEVMQQAATAQAVTNFGKIGHDGKEIVPEESPKVGGFSFVGTPSPAPGVDASPLMTWGEIEGTPFRLDGSETPVTQTPGPTFKIPDIPKRDRIALDLAEKASKAHRDKKEKALQRVSALRTPSPKFSNSPRTDRLAHLSPAAQRLVGKRLGIRTHTDKALRASYTPSPNRTPGEKTPTLTRTPGGKTPSKGITPKSRTPIGVKLNTPKRDASAVSSSSLTDNLLQLPKRKKAEDFF